MPRLFVSTMLYGASKRLGYAEATQELMRQIADASRILHDRPDDAELQTPIGCAVTIARVALTEECVLNVNAGATVIGKARCLAASEFLASDADVWLSVDDDVSVSSDAIAAAVSQARAEPCLVVVPCLLRNTTASASSAAPMVNLVAGPVSIRERAPSGGKVETVDAGGFGCFAVSRAVVEAVRGKTVDGEVPAFTHEGRLVPALFRDEIIDRQWVTEDLAFCRRVAALNFRRWAVRVGVSIHAGQRLDLGTLEAVVRKL